MSKYQFYSIMFALWFVISLTASNPIAIGIAFFFALCYQVGSIYQLFKEEKNVE